MKGKTSKTFGNLISEQEIYEQLYEGTIINTDEEQGRNFGISSTNANDGGGSSKDFIFWN